MGKSLYIAEKPSVAQEFARVLNLKTSRGNGYLESEEAIVTWCVGHLVTMSYPEVYDIKYKKWSLETLPFLPEEFKYEVIENVRKQFETVKGLLTREDVDTIYVCTDSGREGEYIYRLVDQMAGVTGKTRKRVWIDSQTEEEILRGIREAKDWSAYDNLADAAYLRAKEDYLMGINFSRLLTLKYGRGIAGYLGERYFVVSVGRVMTCVLGMVVRREREIRSFVKTPFYRVLSSMSLNDHPFEGEWRAAEGSRYFGSPKLYKENGFKERADAARLIEELEGKEDGFCLVENVNRKQEKKNPPLLFNLAELQNECSKKFKISPDQTLAITQELYEKKLVTYPRTDARVLSTAIAKVIDRNIKGLTGFSPAAGYAADILKRNLYAGLAKTRYVNDSQITDHYAIIPTGQGLGALRSLKETSFSVYKLIVLRFLSVFYPPAVYQKLSLVTRIDTEKFFSSFRVLLDKGYLALYDSAPDKAEAAPGAEEGEEDQELDQSFSEICAKLRKGAKIPVSQLQIKEGETSPPKRYNSGNIIIAMENAGQLIEDETLREQIKSCGIGTSATRAEILKKLFSIHYLSLNKKTQIITPTLNGEMVYDVVNGSIRSLLNPELTASWEKGLNYVAEGNITSDEYMDKLENYIKKWTFGVTRLRNERALRSGYDKAAAFYRTGKRPKESAAKAPDGNNKSTGRHLNA